MEDLELTKAACLRADCAVIMPSIPDAANDDERAESACFTELYEKFEKACRVNRLLADVRRKLEKQIAAGDTGTPDLKPSKVTPILYVY